MTHGIARITLEQREILHARLLRAASVERDAGERLELEDALRRMAVSAYGTCVECAAALPWVRLDARPEAKRCVRCETEHERRRARPEPIRI
jgi:RNA polymerase-binding transcription factor DksA